MTQLLATAAQLSRAEARRLLEAPPLIDRERELFDLDDFEATTEELREHACGCEFCSRTSVPCTATKSSILMARQERSDEVE